MLIIIGRVVECISGYFIVCRIVGVVPIECRLLDIPAERQTCSCERGIDPVVAIHGELVLEQSGPGGRLPRHRIDLDCGIVECRLCPGGVIEHIRQIQNGIRGILIDRHVGNGVSHDRWGIKGGNCHFEDIINPQSGQA